MKRKSVLLFGAALLSVSLMIPGLRGYTVQVASAEEASAAESEDGFTSSMTEDAEDTENQAVIDIPGTLEPGDITVTPEEAAEIEIPLPQKSISMRATEFMPVQDETNSRLLNLYDGVYLLHIKNDSQVFYTLSFNQALTESDLALYRFDSETNTVDPEPVQDILHLDESGSILSLDLNSASDYVLVIAPAKNVTGLGYTSEFTSTAPQEMDNASASEEAVSPSEEAVPPSETNAQMKQDSSEENASAGEDSSAEEANETEVEEPTLTSVRLIIDQDLEAVPAAFLEYVNDLDVYSLDLLYSDGSERVLDETDQQYDLTVDYTDESNSSETISRTYHAVLTEISTGRSFEDTQSIEFGKKDPTEIKTEEMTTVILKGNKKWAMVQSVPSITGRYAMNSDITIDKIYYASDDGEVMCAEDAFDLQQGVAYQFLIQLK